MTTARRERAIRAGLTAAIFAAGFLCGSASQRSADAQLGEVMDKAAGAGGPIGQAAKLGSSIVEMQQHVDALQKNLDTLKQIKSALGG